MEITIVKGDLTDQDVDAIVNPANSKGFMGGGVAAAIKKKGGVEIENWALMEAPIPIGKAALTEGGKLKAHWVIHAPTMELPAQPTTPGKVQKAVLAALKLANKKQLHRIAFPGMGTGVGGLPKPDAANIMITTLKNFRGRQVKQVFLVAHDDQLFEAFTKAKDI